jgi:hypothetical protein
MDNDERDFWPREIATKQVVTPVTVMREQAALLGPKTNYLVEARVRTLAGSDGKGLLHNFELVVPTLDRYVYRLFTLYHEVVNLYPITCVEGQFSKAERPKGLPEEFGPPSRLLKSQTELENYLRLVLHSKETKDILANLMAQARAA